MKKEELTYNVRKDIEKRAKCFNMSFDEYFDSINGCYCISIIGDTTFRSFRTNAGILCEGDGTYRVFPSRDIAEDAIKALLLSGESKVISEAEAIKIMCDAESSVTYQIGEFSIKQLVGGGIEVRGNDFKKNLISIIPIVGNVVQIKVV